MSIIKSISYPKNQRFTTEYNEIHDFLTKCADVGYNEHFHWGRFEWMMVHTMLDEDKTDQITIFKDESGIITGLITYDTMYNDRWYLIHNTDDRNLLSMMIDHIISMDGDRAEMKVNTCDFVLNELLLSRGFHLEQAAETVLSFNLENDLSYSVPKGCHISPYDFQFDPWKYQMLIHTGFGGEGVPEKWDSRVFEPTPNYNGALKVFATNDSEYCSHCGIWYTNGDTAYIEPVVTHPKYRKQGLAKAVVFEAMKRAKSIGAKRAIVISDQAFYYHIGFEQSSFVNKYKTK